MSRFNRSVSIASLLVIVSTPQLLQAQQGYRFQDTHIPAEERITDLIGQMTLDQLLASFVDPSAVLAVQVLDGIGAGIQSALFPIMVADLTRGTGRLQGPGRPRVTGTAQPHTGRKPQRGQPRREPANALA